MRISDWSSDVCSSDLQWSYRVRSAARMATPRQASELVRHDARAAARLRRVHEHGLWPRTRPAEHDRRFAAHDDLSESVHRGNPDLRARSEERRIGTECFNSFRSRWVPEP